MTDRAVDICVYGASGFTGQRVAAYLARRSREGRTAFTFALAGRSAAKLEDVRKSLGNGFSQIKVIVADASDAKSLANMAAQTRVLINCVGPFRFTGLQVVRACVEAQTHYVDITGEPEFVEQAMVEFDAEAKKQDVLVVPCCGFDSVPADVGAVYACQQFEKRHPDGLLAQLECFMTLHAPNGTSLHYATYESFVHGVANAHKLHKIRSALRKQQTDGGRLDITRVGPPLKVRNSMAFDGRVGRWTYPFPGSDVSIVKNSQLLEARRLDNQERSKSAVQPYYAEYFTTNSIFTMLLIGVFGAILRFLAGFQFTRNIILKFPRLFTLGFFSHEGPSQTQLDSTTCTFTFYGQGYRSPNVQQKFDASIETRVILPEPGYVATPICAGEAALCILAERTRLDFPSGVVTPAAAFRHSTYIERLQEHSVTFQVVN